MELTVLFLGRDEEASWSSERLRELGIEGEVRSASGSPPSLETAAGEYVLVVEPGRRLSPELLGKMWARRGDSEVVLASRYARGASRGSAAGRRANLVLRRALRLPCYEPTSGIRLYKKTALEEIGASSSVEPIEILVRLYNAGFKIREVPLDDRHRENPLRSVREPARKLLDLPRLRRLRDDPGAADAEDSAFESLLPWRRRFLETRQKTIVSFLEVDVPVLDVGCGSSRLVQALSKGVGLDKDLRKLRFLRGRARAMVSGELTRLPFRDGSFRQAVLSDVLEKLPRDEPYLPELRRVLGRYGTLVLTSPVGGRRSEPALRDELQGNGFTVDEVRRVFKRELVVRAVRRES